MFDRTLNNQALYYAVTQLGACEDPPGSNRGVEVANYLRSVGLPGGYAWCAAFVHWCYQTAADELSVLNPVWKTAGVMTHWRECHRNGGKRLDRLKISPSAILPGMIFVMDYGGGKGHTGIVESVDVKGERLTAIEGNTNEAGSREGIYVMRRERRLIAIKGFIDYEIAEVGAGI